MGSINNSINHICQNCGADLNGNYCTNCGQKSDTAYNRTIFSLIGQFFDELFDWDARFFLSVKYLFTRPGLLTHEYISGRVQRYVSPLKMFLFSSFVLFFIMIKSDPDQYKAIVTDAAKDDFMREFILEQKADSGQSDVLYIEHFNDQFNNNITLYIFFIMFMFSILLKVIYLPKHYFYAEHIVFTLHFFTFVLWSFLIGVFTQGLGDIFVLLFAYLIPGIYLFIALKKVYHKTVWKALLVSAFMTFSFWILITIWIIGTVFLSAIRAA